MILKGELAIFNQRIIFALYESLNFDIFDIKMLVDVSFLK